MRLRESASAAGADAAAGSRRQRREREAGRPDAPNGRLAAPAERASAVSTETPAARPSAVAAEAPAASATAGSDVAAMSPFGRRMAEAARAARAVALPVPAPLVAEATPAETTAAAAAAEANRAEAAATPAEAVAVVVTSAASIHDTITAPIDLPATLAAPAAFTDASAAPAVPAAPAAVKASVPRSAWASVSTPAGSKRVLPRLRRTSAGEARSPRRTVATTVVMVATAGLVATLALPAYAYNDSNSPSTARTSASTQLGIQKLTVNGVAGQTSVRDGYTTTGNLAAMDSTEGTTVSPTVQALAAELMSDVASGKLVGSVPDHIAEIRNLANGVAVQGCGVDYRVLQTIKVAVDNFDKVGVSDINRHCTGQIEGAGTASSHYKDGGGHAVDFYILNGHGLTGADSDSIKLITLLDPMVPSGSGLGQSECRSSSLPLSNFAPFADTCTHVHIDFGNAKGVSLTQ